MLTLNKDVGFVGMASEPTNYEQSCEFLVPIKQLESVSLTIQESNKKRKVKSNCLEKIKNFNFFINEIVYSFFNFIIFICIFLGKIPVQQPKTEDLKKPSKIGSKSFQAA